MPQVFDAVCCGACGTFQVSLRGQTKKQWTCVMCGAKQSYTRIFASGAAKDVRPIVQQLNASRGSVPEFSAAQDARRSTAAAVPQPQEDEEFTCAFGGAATAPSFSDSRSACDAEERRIDVNDADAGAFTRSEFLEFYGGSSIEWERAQRLPGAYSNTENCWQQQQQQQRMREPAGCSLREEEEEGDLYVTSIPHKRVGEQKRPKRAHDGPAGQDARRRQRLGDGPASSDGAEPSSWGQGRSAATAYSGYLGQLGTQQPRMARPGAAALQEEEEDVYQTRAEVLVVEEEVWQG